ncbi:hypothetical protein UlMin_015888 [Ulmus minor]
MAPYEALYGRKCRSTIHWYETGETQIAAPDFIETTTEAVKKIKERMETAQSRQKSYADKRRRPLEFQVGDAVFLKVAPMKGVMRFGKKGKLNPSHVLEHEPIEVHEDLTYEEKPVQILDRKEKTLRNKVIPLIKVLKFSWSREEGPGRWTVAELECLRRSLAAGRGNAKYHFF